MANRRLFPAVDVLKSISRLTPQIVPEEILTAQSVIFELESIYRENSDLIQLGLYKKGTSPLIDLAIWAHSRLEGYIRQGINQRVNLKESFEQLLSLVNSILEEGSRHGVRWNNGQFEY
jgi:flagellum-specific ATP synthase